MRKVLAIVLPLAFSRCALSPLRVFQAKVPAPLEKPAAQIESERQAADLIARTIEQPVALITVAQKLSVSLGAPEKPFALKNLTESAQLATREIDAALLFAQKRQSAQNVILAKYQGKEIEGTGLSLLGPGVVTIIAALAALGILCPPAFTLLAFAYRRLRSTAGMIVTQIDSAANSDEGRPVVDKIKANLAVKMDVLNKRVVHSLKKPVAG